MKLLLVLGSEPCFKAITGHMKNSGCEFIRYSHVVKAMDNIDEIDPSGIIISASDYPRHWKAFVQFVRSARSAEECPLVLLRGENFKAEDIVKGFYAGVNAIIDEALESAPELSRLQSVIERRAPPEEKLFYPGGNRKSLNFLLALPENGPLVPGEIKAISSGRLVFLPDYAGAVKDLASGMEFTGCSLRVEKAILSPVCRLAGIGRNITFEFISFPDSERKILKDYIENLTAAA